MSIMILDINTNGCPQIRK